MCCTALSFFASDQNYANFLHVLTIIELSVHTFGAYIIIAKTPKKLESVKASMLYLHFVGAFVDVYFSVLIMPVLHLPVCGGHPAGLLSFFGVPVLLQTYVGLPLPAVMGATIVVFLEDRRYRLVNGQKSSSNVRKWYRFLFVALNYIYATKFHAPKSQCIPADFFDHPNFFLLDLNGNYIAICLLLLIIILFCQMMFQFGLIFRHLLKNTPVSRCTIRLQQQFFIAMSMQVILPIVIIAFPVSYMLYSIVSGYYNQGANNLTFMIISMHGVLSTLTMLMAYRHYRESIMEMLNLE
nr:hypothetical protein F20E11.8 - Caenorhabditis elegans [Caenorhabditis elegans]